MTTVSVVIPVYNRAATVRAAIDSILGQKVNPADIRFDIVIVDDGSTDDLAGALAPFIDRIRLVRHSGNQGAAAARNTGVSESHGDYVAFLDSDDVWLPEKTEVQLAIMRERGWRVCCTAYYLSRLKGKEIVSPRYRTQSLQLADLVWGCFVSPGSTMMFEKAAFEAIGPLDTHLKRLEDWDWLLRYGKIDGLGFLARPLARINLVPNIQISKVQAAVEYLEHKHLASLPGAIRRKFRAALALEWAAANYRVGNIPGAMLGILRSLWLAPNNAALAALIHNRVGRMF